MATLPVRRKAIAAWCLFDWALTPFHTVINTFVFSVYFSRGIYGDEVGGSAAWSYAASAAGLLVALLSPAERRHCRPFRPPQALDRGVGPAESLCQPPACGSACRSMARSA